MKKIFLSHIIFSGFLFAQQVDDPDFNPVIAIPAYSYGAGPKIYVDEAHNNFHTMGGEIQAFC